MKKLRIFGLYLAFCSLTAYASSSGPFSGQVLEADTREPIADAHVLVGWGGEIAFASQGVCIHAEGTITDQQGRFATKAWSEESGHGKRMSPGGPDIEAYKPGYAVSYSSKDWEKEYKKGIVLMEPYRGNNQERMQYLEELARRAQCFGTDEKSLFQMQRAIYLEGKALAVSDRDKLRVRGLRVRAATVWLGGDSGGLDIDSVEAMIQKDNYLSEQLKDGPLQPEPVINGTVTPPPKLHRMVPKVP